MTYACLYLREFPAQALLRLRPELRGKPVVVMEGEPPLEQVCSLNAKGARTGHVQGMTPVEVDTFSGVTVLPRSLKEEAATKAVLLECAGAFSPRVEDCCEDSAFLCVVDIAGTERLFGPAEAQAQKLLKRVRALGMTGCIAVSGNFHAAIALARGLSPRTTAQVVRRGEEAVALAPLPVSVLDLTEEQAETFSLWGIRTLGMLAALPEKELVARMGQAGKASSPVGARRVVRICFSRWSLRFTLEEQMELDAPVEVAGLAALCCRRDAGSADSARNGARACAGIGHGYVERWRAVQRIRARCGLLCRRMISSCGSSCFISIWRRIHHRLRFWRLR